MALETLFGRFGEITMFPSKEIISARRQLISMAVFRQSRIVRKEDKPCLHHLRPARRGIQGSSNT